ncbi:aminopeptidase P N-terminal domain-containing protein [Temperatibacter marinus]|uniref:Xaa-Pro aminopeptidase n=1 Tax=Temperatibacter marinus TaxID=1456591 RepID=A0AA52H9N5_9PROT|nr:aminopeptidase P N-terminal domain-containing protein [Temperatibacter marinus]WND01793.1 aminopeptidase P N-terminal domain-containing protein [Temperatibacter marinus]
MTDIYAERRRRLFDTLDSDSVVILAGHQEQVRSKNILYPFRQNSDFYYLTGCSEPDAAALLRPGHADNYTLFVRPRDKAQEISFGDRLGIEGAREQLAATSAYSIGDLSEKIPEMLEERCQIFLSDELGRFDTQVRQWLDAQRRSAKFDDQRIYRSLHSILPLVHQMRCVKDEHEIALLRQAVKATEAGHKALMEKARPGAMEVTLSGAFMGEIGHHGCAEVGYPNIVASGNNACCLHYTDYGSALKSGDMILVDAGAEYKNYTADVTRSYPVTGQFSALQKDVYTIVLAGLDASIALVKPGLLWSEIYETNMKVLSQGLIDLGLLKGSLDEVLEKDLHKPYTIHKTGHWLGLDVHDVGRYREADGRWVTLQEGMVFTIEPGLYFPQSCETVPEEFRGMGIRIEDDILVTKNGHENLTASIPRTVTDIEDYMKR